MMKTFLPRGAASCCQGAFLRRWLSRGAASCCQGAFLRRFMVAMPLVLVPIVLVGQGRGVAPKDLYKPLSDSWPTYSGDYSGKRYSALKQIDQTTVKTLTLARDDGTLQSFRRNGDNPKVEIHDPAEPHRALLAVYTEKDIHDVTAYLVTLK